MSVFARVCRLCAALGVPVVMSACGPSPVLRADPGPCDYGRTQCSTSSREETPYVLNFIDISSNGTMTKPAQLEWADRHIREAAARQPDQNLVIVFVHGWFHSDFSRDRDVNRARDTLNWFAHQHPGWHVEGVFVGWQAYTKWPAPFQYLTFWSKEHNADAMSDPKVGGDALSLIVQRMDAAVNLSANNKLVFIGHSFGGRALFNATKGTLLHHLQDSYSAWQQLGLPGKPEQQPVRGVGSLVLLIEPAITADSFTDLYNTSNRLYVSTLHDKERHRKPIFALNDRPLFLAVTSSADLPVKLALPVSSVFSAQTPGKTILYHWDPKEHKPTEVTNQQLAHQALGHEDDLLTHHFEINGNVSQSCGNTKSIRYGGIDADLAIATDRLELPRGWLQCAIHDKADHNGSPTGSKFDALVVASSCAQIRHLGNTSPYNPYWNASSNESFIQGHSAFMNKSVIILMNQLIFSEEYDNGQPNTACHYKGEYPDDQNKIRSPTESK